MKRFINNPLISPVVVPAGTPALEDVSAVFNPGAVGFRGGVSLLLRVQNRGRETFILHAHAADGFDFTIDPQPVAFQGIEAIAETIYHVYDPRITPLEDRFLITLALDTDRGCWMGLAETWDFKTYRFLGLIDQTDTRNGVVFPQKVDGAYLRLDRPNGVTVSGGVRSGNSIRLSRSQDLLHWQEMAVIASGRPRYWDELIGSGPPPLRVAEGWLHLYHGVATHFGSSNIYQAGVMLLDAKDPSKVLARSRYNILEPRKDYELMGQVPNVVFPSGWVAEEEANGIALPESRVLIYYGAADTHVCLMLTSVAQLIEACYAGNK